MSAALMIALLLALCGPVPTSSAAAGRLTNGCRVTARGIPSCGAYFGAAYGANTNVNAWERSMGKRLGVHRTYWGGRDVSSAVRTARADAAKNRLPWLSFKAPYSWAAMARGRGDSWARRLATRLRSIGGPVWVAVHHEPEGDGNMQTWKAMQRRLAPIMRRAAPNLGYSIILMGYHQFQGSREYALSRTWPRTKIDVAGFDIYEKYGVQGDREWKLWNRRYFTPIERWARSKGVAWGLAETGYSHAAARADNRWMRRTYDHMRAHGGVAFSYFNTNLHSKTDWRLNIATKRNAFTRVNRTAPTLR